VKDCTTLQEFRRGLSHWRIYLSLAEHICHAPRLATEAREFMVAEDTGRVMKLRALLSWYTIHKATEELFQVTRRRMLLNWHTVYNIKCK